MKQLLSETKNFKGETRFLGPMLTGLVSRSSHTAKVHRLFRDGKATESDFEAAITSDSKKLILEQGNFAFISGGQLDWLDIIRPIAQYFGGFGWRNNNAFKNKMNDDSCYSERANPPKIMTLGPVTRWFRTNTFYRKPHVSGRIECIGDELAEIMPETGENSVIFLPAPYSLARLVENIFYDNLGDLAKDYARAIAKSGPKLREKGYSCILLLEPFVGFELSGNSFRLPDWFSDSVSLAKENDIKLGINFPKAEAEEVVPIIEDSKVDFIGVDLLYSTSFRVNTSKDLLLGTVDGGSIRVETSANIRHIVSRCLESAEFSGRYYIGPNDRLYDVPFDFALRKIEALSRLAGEF
jgi:methionine synthase II (cobalamin-independent)